MDLLELFITDRYGGRTLDSSRPIPSATQLLLEIEVHNAHPRLLGSTACLVAQPTLTLLQAAYAANGAWLAVQVIAPQAWPAGPPQLSAPTVKQLVTDQDPATTLLLPAIETQSPARRADLQKLQSFPSAGPGKHDPTRGF